VRLLSLGGLSVEETLKAYAELMSSARRPEDKKLVLAGLAKVADPAALKAVEPFLADAKVRAEAESATVKIARGIMGSAPEEARAAAKKLQAASKRPGVRNEAARILRQIETLGDYITAWQLAGPYPKEGQTVPDVFAAAFPPEKPGAKGVAWRALAPGGGQRPWMFDLHSILGGEHRACYVRTWVHSPKDQPARLEFGTDDGGKVWFNGKVVHADATGGAATPGEHKVKVALRKGPNALMLKVTQLTGPWQFCLRIRTPDGGELEGLRVRPQPPAD